MDVEFSDIFADESIKPTPLTLKSNSFFNQGEIPSRFTCEGKDISPALTWSGIPQKAKSLALIVDDPDAPDPAEPKITWVHWVLYNIPSTASEFKEDVVLNNLPPGTKGGKNDWNRAGYRGPCPPVGRHRYFFKLYALDVILPDLKTPDKAQLEKAMKEHVIDHAELIGTYQKK